MDAPGPSTRLRGDEPAAAAREGLPDRRELAFVAVERTRMPMVVTNPRLSDNPIIWANQAFLDMSGYPAEAVIGRNCRFLQGGETDRATIAAIRTAIAERRDITVELLNYRRSGEAFWCQLFLSPIFDDDGQLMYFFGSQLDVTERRKVAPLEAAQHRLLREVDHRAMNALALVDGIVRLTRAVDAGRYAAAVQRRVQALARAHTLLAELGWRPAPLERVLRDQIEPFGVDRVRLSGPEVALPGDIVQPLALVLHELIANAADHGSLSAPAGDVHIDWRTDKHGARLDLAWRETGGPPPADHRPAGFGSAIMEAIIDRQLGGEIRRSWKTEGFSARLSLPLAA